MLEGVSSKHANYQKLQLVYFCVPIFVQFAVILCSLCEEGNVAEIFFFFRPTIIVFASEPRNV